MKEIISGFRVVKSSEFFFSTEPYNKLSNAGSKRYEGIFRMHLYDVLEEYYNKILPIEISVIVENSLKENNDMTIEIIKNFNDALKVLEYSKKKSDNNEIISLKSETLHELKGSFIFSEREIEWLGFDVISYGNGSLILDGILFKNQYFEKWIPSLNRFGLFNSIENIDEFISYYIDLSKRNIVEELPFNDYGFDTIAVGKVKL